MDNLETFLIDDKINDRIFKTRYYQFKIHKEKYDDRFLIIYTQDCAKGLIHSDYCVSGYFDIKDKVLYKTNCKLNDLIIDNINIVEGSFNGLFNKLVNELENKIKEYSLKHKEEFMKLAKNKFEQETMPHIKHYEVEIQNKFIANDDNIDLSLSFFRYNIERLEECSNKSLHIGYLNNPKKTINRYVPQLIEEYKERIGYELLLNDYQNKYLDKIKDNKNNEFSKLYLYQKLYNSIKDLNVKTLNITIQYDNESLTFKYDYNKLICDLKNGYGKSATYIKSYEPISDFIKKAKGIDKNSGGTEEFDFENISLITFSNKELYRKKDAFYNDKSKISNTRRKSWER